MAQLKHKPEADKWIEIHANCKKQRYTYMLMEKSIYPQKEVASALMVSYTCCRMAP